jgi:hypothetical protein
MHPEQVLAQFLEVNPHSANPRDLGRILFHTPRLSPYAIAVILFNSQYSCRALSFSFMSAIDLDCISIIDGIRFITQKVAIPTRSNAIRRFASSFASAYSLRNQFEWPDRKIVQNIFCAVLCHCVLDSELEQCFARFETLKAVQKAVLSHVAADVLRSPPAFYFTSVPSRIDPILAVSGDVEHEGRFRSSWKMYRYSKEGDELVSRDLKDKRKTISKLPLKNVIAKQKLNNSKKPYSLVLQRADGHEFGWKVNKDGSLKPSSRTSYALALKSEPELVMWMSAVNQISFLEEVRTLK